MHFAASRILAKEPRSVAILGYEGVSALDLTGPFEALTLARSSDHRGIQSPCYKPVIVGLTSKAFLAESGLPIKAHSTIDSTARFDTIIIPGGRGLRQAETNRRAAAWLSSKAGSTRRIASVSTGIYALAQSGLVDGQTVATHWRYSRDVAQRFPKLQIDSTAVFLRSDAYYTSAGGKAGIEMTLALIEQDCGAQVARAVADEMVMRLRPAGEHHTNPRAANFQLDPPERVADLPQWILAHLHENLTVDVLAEKACLCTRHFGRVFKQVFSCTPADFVEELRLSEARRRLLGMRSTVEEVALNMGFHSADAFRRAFERRVGMSPAAFRRKARDQNRRPFSQPSNGLS